MIPIKKVLLRYLLPFLVVYAVLMALTYTSGIQQRIHKYSRNNSEWVLSTIFPAVQFFSDPSKVSANRKAGSKITIAFANKQQLEQQLQRDLKQQSNAVTEIDFRSFEYDIYETFLIGNIFLFSLILITPISWRRRLIALGIAGVIVYILNGFYISLLAIDDINSAQIGVLSLSESALNILLRIKNPLYTGYIFVIPVLIWGLLCFRQGDWKDLQVSTNS